MKFKNNRQFIDRLKNNSDLALNDKKLSNFIKILSNLFIKSGKKQKISRCFEKVNILISKELSQSSLEFFYKVFVKLRPVVALKPQHQGRLRRLIPYPITSNRQIFLTAKWLKLAVERRSERDLHLRIFNELRDVLQHKGKALKYKHDFYEEIVRNRSFIRLLRFRKK